MYRLQARRTDVGATRFSASLRRPSRRGSSCATNVVHCALMSDKSCLITGATSGIGRAIALAFSQEEASLLLHGRNAEKLHRTAEQCKEAGAPRCEVITADLSDLEQVKRTANHALEMFGTVDVLVNNAGIVHQPNGPHCLQGDPGEWSEMMNVNAIAPMALMRMLTPGMVAQEDGVVINICSTAGVEPMKSYPAYAASKWALRGWSLSCYEELRNYNVKVCTINPMSVRRDSDDVIPRSGNVDRMLEMEDIAEVAMLPFRTSSKCVPSDITLRLTRYAR